MYATLLLFTEILEMLKFSRVKKMTVLELIYYFRFPICISSIITSGISPQHIHRLTQNNILFFEEDEFDKKEGSIVIYSDTALEKFIKYSQESHRGRKKKEIDE